MLKIKTLENFYSLCWIPISTLHALLYLFSFSHSFHFFSFLYTVQDRLWGAQFPLLQKHSGPSLGLFYQPSHASQSRFLPSHLCPTSFLPLGVISIPFRSRGFILYSIPGVGSLKNSTRPTRDSEVGGSEREGRSQPPIWLGSVCLSILCEACTLLFNPVSPGIMNLWISNHSIRPRAFILQQSSTFEMKPPFSCIQIIYVLRKLKSLLDISISTSNGRELTMSVDSQMPSKSYECKQPMHHLHSYHLMVWVYHNIADKTHMNVPYTEGKAQTSNTSTATSLT